MLKTLIGNPRGKEIFFLFIFHFELTRVVKNFLMFDTLRDCGSRFKSKWVPAENSRARSIEY